MVSSFEIDNQGSDPQYIFKYAQRIQQAVYLLFHTLHHSVCKSNNRQSLRQAASRASQEMSHNSERYYSFSTAGLQQHHAICLQWHDRAAFWRSCAVIAGHVTDEKLMCIMFLIVTRLVILNLAIFWWSAMCITSVQSPSEELQEIFFACYFAVTCVKYQWHTDSSTESQSAVETLLKHFWKPLDLDELKAVTSTRALYNSVSCFAWK